MTEDSSPPAPVSSSGVPSRNRWITRSVVGIILATFFSDFGHEIATAILPLYLGSLGYGAAALGVMEGVADLLMGVSRVAGGFVGHHTEHKRPLAAFGYLATTLGTASMALVSSAAGLVGLRAFAWAGRGFRSPLRDFILADAVEPTHFGRAYGLERAGDMLGAVVGPLTAALLVALGIGYRSILLVTLGPGLVAAWAMYFLTHERETTADGAQARGALPASFRPFLVAVGVFGLGDFSRTFLVLLVARALGAQGYGGLSIAVLVYALHNLVSAAVAYPVGRWGDRIPQLRVLQLGYLLGVSTNVIRAARSGSVVWLVVATVLSGTYIAVEETMEKAAAAEFLPRDVRSLGMGWLAAVNAAGDMASSVAVGVLLDQGFTILAFALPACCGLVASFLLAAMRRRTVAT